MQTKTIDTIVVLATVFVLAFINAIIITSMYVGYELNKSTGSSLVGIVIIMIMISFIVMAELDIGGFYS